MKLSEEVKEAIRLCNNVIENADYMEYKYMKEYKKSSIDILVKEIERLNKTLEDIVTYIHLWKLEEIGEKTMLILNDILLIKNGMSDEVVRLKERDKECI